MNEQDSSPELDELDLHETLSGWKVTVPVFLLPSLLYAILILFLIFMVVGALPAVLIFCGLILYLPGNIGEIAIIMMSTLAITFAPVLVMLSESLRATFHVEGDDMAVQHSWMGRTWRTHRIPLSEVDTDRLNQRSGARLHLSSGLKPRVSLPPAQRALLRDTITESARGADAPALPPEPEALRRLRAAERESS